MKSDPAAEQGEASAGRWIANHEVLTASELARYCHVDLKTIHNWVNSGMVRHFRTPGRHLRFRRADAIEFLRRFGYPLPESMRGGKPRVIVVDESASQLASLRKALSKRFDVATFEDPIEALVAVGQDPPDVLVLHGEIPGLDALRCIERLKALERTSHVRIVVNAREDGRKKFVDAGAYHFALRGDAVELREIVERALERS